MPVAAQSDNPNKPIKWIAGYPPDGTPALLARLMGQWQQFWALHRMETEKRAKIVQFAGAKAE